MASRKRPLIPGERKQPLWMVGQEGLLEASSQWATVFSVCHQLRVVLARALKGVFQFWFVLKDVGSAKCVQTHFFKNYLFIYLGCSGS